jgi:O-antigen/teichoic acid export membrane protein
MVTPNMQAGAGVRAWINPGLMSHIINGGWMIAEQGLRLLAAVVLSIWLARMLGPASYGELSYALSFASIFAVVATLGLNRTLVRELVSCGDKPLERERLMTTAFAMRVLASVASYILCVVIAWSTAQQHFVLIALVAGGFLFGAADCAELYFQSINRAHAVAKVRSVAFLLVTAVRVGLLVVEADVWAFALLAMLEHATAALALRLLYRARQHSDLHVRADWSLAARMVRESWPEIAASFVGMLFMRLDQIMLEQFATARDLGVYAAASKLSEAWHFVPAAIVAVVFPAIVKLRESASPLFLDQLQLLMTSLCAVSYAAALIATIFARYAVESAFGSAYAQSGMILIVHVWGGVFIALGLASGAWMVAQRMAWLNLCRNLSGLAVQLVLSGILIPRFGALGAAYSTLVALAVAYLLFDFLIPGTRELGCRKIRALLILPTWRLK